MNENNWYERWIMSLFKILSHSAQKLPNRFLGNGFETMGAVIRKPRTNSSQELISSIKAYACENPVIKNFSDNIQNINTKHLGLAQDIIDLSNTREMLCTHINMLDNKNGNNSILKMILEKFPVVSKNNPDAIELAQEVVNHSDIQNSKYFLTKFFACPIENFTHLAPQMKAVKKIVPHIAKDTLSGGYTMDFSKNEKFFQFLTSLISRDAKPENIELIDKIMEFVNKFSSKLNLTCNLSEIKTADSAKLKENLKILPEVLKNLSHDKNFEVAEFLSKNTNLTP